MEGRKEKHSTNVFVNFFFYLFCWVQKYLSTYRYGDVDVDAELLIYSISNICSLFGFLFIVVEIGLVGFFQSHFAYRNWYTLIEYTEHGIRLKLTNTTFWISPGSAKRRREKNKEKEFLLYSNIYIEYNVECFWVFVWCI